MKTIVVNNPAAKYGGALTILKQFIESINKYNHKNMYYIIVSVEELKKYEDKYIKILIIPQQGFKSRILWDNYGLKKYLKEKNIVPDLFISFQNTAVNLHAEIKQIIYYHQPLSISKENWNPFNNEERLFWMYKNIFPFFIKQYLSRVVKVVVQTEWVKKAFSKKFNYKPDNIEVIKPEFKLPNIDEIKKQEKTIFRIFYPAPPIKYKNHYALIEIISKLEDMEFECIFTFDKEENSTLDDLIKKENLEDKIKLIGKISYEEVLEYYKSCHLVIFPSTIETFGLPLVEAASLGKSLLVADKPYSREVIGDYKGATFIDIKNKDKWIKEIKKNIEEKREFDKFKVNYSTGWENFFELIDKV